MWILRIDASARKAIEVSMLDFILENADRSDIESLRDNCTNSSGNG